MRYAAVFLTGLFLLLWASLWESSHADEAPCAADTIGIDVSEATTYGGAFLGDSPGQTFLASDTLLHSLTVWRAENQPDNVFGLHLFITEMTPSGYPDAFRIVLDGPTIFHTDGDGVHPTEFRWQFDPPFALPGARQYAFFLVPVPCHGLFDVLAVGNTDPYPDGDFWGSGRGCILTGSPYPNRNADMIFQMEFCTDAPTSVKPRSWGNLKIIYR